MELPRGFKCPVTGDYCGYKICRTATPRVCAIEVEEAHERAEQRKAYNKWALEHHVATLRPDEPVPAQPWVWMLSDLDI